MTISSISSNLDYMKTLSANEAKQSLGRVLDSAQREPVIIQKHNRPTAVVMSVEEYDRLRGLNVSDFAEFCDTVGKRAQSRGLTENRLAKMLAEG